MEPKAILEVPLARETAPATPVRVLVVDLEGTLLKTNLLLELLLALLKKNPLYVFVLPAWLARGKAYLKQQISARVELEASVLPYRSELLDYIRAQGEAGRSLVLAAADVRLAKHVADHWKLFDSVVASDSISSEALHSSHVAWAAPRSSLATYLKPLRPEHWLKNLLIFVPLFAAHRFFEIGLWERTVLAFVAFGCCASAGYILNDLFDLPADRHHPDKRLRPFASGDLPLSYGLAMIPILLGLGCLIGLWVSLPFLATLLIYLALTTTYSLYVRKVVLLDVILLAGLYTIRLMAGSGAIAVWPSHWLLAFSTFLFFSLALVKRYGELVIMRRVDGDHAKARGYELGDGELLAAMGIASGYLAVLVLALYINSDTAAALYGRYQLIWFLCPLLLYWISHIWLFAHRGKMPDDPVLFATTNRVSCVLILLMAAVVLLAL